MAMLVITRWYPATKIYAFLGLTYSNVGVSENRLNPIVPNGFADHYPYEKWLAIIGNINPTFSDKPMYTSFWLVVTGTFGLFSIYWDIFSLNPIH